MGLQRRIEISVNDLITRLNKLDAITDSISETNDEFSKKIIKVKCNESKYSSRQVWISNQSIQLVCE